MNPETRIHSTAEVHATMIGPRTKVWQNVVILEGAVLGSDCEICAHCFIESDVRIGDRVTLKPGGYLWNGITLGNDVFVGPNVTFTHDRFPRSKESPQTSVKTIVEDGVAIGGGAVILPGVTIGRGAMIGAGSVVTHDVPPNAVITGNPGRVTGYVQSLPKDQPGDWKFSPGFSEEVGSRELGIGGVTLHRLKQVQDPRGDLSVGEFSKDIPFTPKRYFLVYNVASHKIRGEHAHRECHQFLIAIKGHCSVVVDDGKHRAEILLNACDQGIYLPPMTWGIQYKYSPDAVLLVFASHGYDPGDYIRDYSDFIKTVNDK